MKMKKQMKRVIVGGILILPFLAVGLLAKLLGAGVLIVFYGIAILWVIGMFAQSRPWKKYDTWMD